MKKIIGAIILVIVLILGFVAFRTYQGKFGKTVINIQPLDNIEDVNRYSEKLDHYLKEIGLENYEIKVLPNKQSPDNSLVWFSYEDMDYFRLRADSLVRFLNTNDKKEFTIGITNYDICCDVHGIKNWGVLGLSYLGKKYNSCVISTLRVKDDKDAWKVVAHEFTHAHFSQNHCKADDPHCIMQDAKKKPKLGIKNHLCDTCMKEIKSKLKNRD